MKYFFPEPADADERELLTRLGDPSELGALTPEALRDSTLRNGCDFATATMHRCIIESERHGPFLHGLENASKLAHSSGARVAVIPGAFYRENPATGADGRVVSEVAEKLGLPVELIPVSSTGRLKENAGIIADWLRARRNETWIIVSVSKGGSDLKMALAHDDAPQVFEPVAAWINLCGILDGSPMADWLLSPNLLARANRFVYRIRGRSLDFLEEMQRFPGCALDFPLKLPEHLRAFHVVGFPLRKHLRNGLARRCHARLETYGPSDGSIVLSDVLGWPGQLCPVWGADHYLRPRLDERPLLEALLKVCASSRGTPAAHS